MVSKAFRTALATTLLAVGTCGFATAQTIDINLGHVLSEQSSYQAGALRFKELLEERAPGRFNVNIFPAGGLGGEIQLIQGIRTGTVDATIIGQPSLENTVQEYRILSLPYLFESQTQATELLQGDLGDKLLEILPKYNITGLGWGGVFERNLTSTRPVTSLEDMKGLKVRVIQSPGYVEAYRALGTQPTPTAYAELFLALQNRVVDACELGPDQVVSDGFLPAISDYVITRVHHLPSLMLISPIKLNQMPDDLQKIVREAGREAMAAAVEAHQENIEKGFKALREANIRFHEPDLGPFRDAARQAWGPILAQVPGGDAIMADIEAAKAN